MQRAELPLEYAAVTIGRAMVMILVVTAAMLFSVLSGVAGADAALKTRLKASDSSTWKPVPYRAEAPTRGVTLGDEGLFKPVLENNITYLLNSFSVNHMLWPFRIRAGQKDPPDDRPQVRFWDTDLRGSNAGRFLMGAGNTLRWMEHPELRNRLNELIDGIEACREPNGYILAYPPDKTRSEEPNYARAWFTHGLIEAGIAGNPKAWRLLRGHADWFNQWEMLPRLINCCSNAHQGHIASTRTYFSPVGKPEDLQVAEKYYVCDWWMDQLAARDTDALWKYPLPTPHSYLITSFEAYLDHYRATGDRRYLDAMRGAWDLIHDHWEHVGGSMAICEGPAGSFPPDSYYLTPKGHTGETCGSVFWIKFNQRFHQLYPTEEKYVNEIEKSIYNVCLPNQAGGKGIRYHARMEGTLDKPNNANTCCEGQGTRLFGSLPEYIYSIAGDGLYVNLFEPSSIRWQVAGEEARLEMKTGFPRDPQVELKVGVPEPLAMKLRVRVPAWAPADMPIAVNGRQAATGKPGAYAVLDRTWAAGDTVTFTLPMGFRVTRYAGVDQIKGHTRYALEYGPILLAAVGPLDDKFCMRIVQSPETAADWLQPQPDQPLHFTARGHSDCEFMPCWDIGRRTFTCCPVFEALAIDGTTPFLVSTEVTMMSPVAGAVIRFTTDGTEPTARSPAYSGTLEIRKTCTVRARAFVGDQPKTPVADRRFQRASVMAPAIRPQADTNLIEMVLPPQSAKARIHYTLDGSEPTAQSPRYLKPLPMPSEKTVIRARAILPGLDPSPAVEFVAGSGAAGFWAAPDVHLSDLSPLKATAGWNTVKSDRNIVGKPLSLCGTAYEKGMGVHARSELVYALKPEYRRFVALVGIDDQAIADRKVDPRGFADKGSVVFEVSVDDDLLYRTPVLVPAQRWHIDLPLPAGAHHLRLVVTDGGDDFQYDWGDWVLAGFKGPTKKTLSEGG